MAEEVSMVFNSLPELEHSLCDEVKMVLIHIAGYVGLNTYSWVCWS